MFLNYSIKKMNSLSFIHHVLSVCRAPIYLLLSFWGFFFHMAFPAPLVVIYNLNIDFLFTFSTGRTKDGNESKPTENEYS